MTARSTAQVPPIERERYRFSLLEGIKRERAMVMAAEKKGVKVSDADIAAEREKIDEEAESDEIQSELGGGLSGPAVLQRAFGERVSYRVRDVPLNDDEARQWARAEMLRRSRGFVTAVGTTNGTPDMVVGSRLTLQRVGAPFNGAGYYVVSVNHSYDRKNGYRTHFTAERASVNQGAS